MTLKIVMLTQDIYMVVIMSHLSTLTTLLMCWVKDQLILHQMLKQILSSLILALVGMVMAVMEDMDCLLTKFMVMGTDTIMDITITM